MYICINIDQCHEYVVRCAPDSINIKFEKISIHPMFEEEEIFKIYISWESS